MLVKAALKMYKIAALAQTHSLSHSGKLVEVRRKISDTPNTGLRKIVKFHARVQSDFHETVFSATVHTVSAVIEDIPIPDVEGNQLSSVAQVLLESGRISIKFRKIIECHGGGILHNGWAFPGSEG
jgi:hypothetical protein